jgi:hypothetical protein
MCRLRSVLDPVVLSTTIDQSSDQYTASQILPVLQVSSSQASDHEGESRSSPGHRVLSLEGILWCRFHPYCRDPKSVDPRGIEGLFWYVERSKGEDSANGGGFATGFVLVHIAIPTPKVRQRGSSRDRPGGKIVDIPQRRVC